MRQKQDQNSAGLRHESNGFTLVVRAPGSYRIIVPKGQNFLDVYLGKSKGRFEIKGLEELGNTSHPQSFTFLPSNGRHEMSASRSAWSVQLHFGSDIMDTLIARLPDIDPLGVRTICHGEDSSIQGIAQLLNGVWNSDGSALDDAQLDSICLLLATRVSQHFAMGVQTTPQMSSSSKRIQAVLEYIEANISGSLTLDTLAEIAAISPYHFARVFRRATGRSPHQYVVERRLAHAKRRLHETEDAIATIAIDCGFGSQSHMTDVFGKVLGVTPGAVRKSLI